MLFRRPTFTILFVLLYLVRVPSKVKAQDDTQGTAKGKDVDARDEHAVASSGGHGSSGGHSSGSSGGHSSGASEGRAAPAPPAGREEPPLQPAPLGPASPKGPAPQQGSEPVPGIGSGPKPPPIPAPVAGPKRDLPAPPPKPKNGTKGAALLLVGLAALALGGVALQQEHETASKKYLKGLPLPKINPDDPSDEVINQGFWYHGRRIYEHNRCALFREAPDSHPNKRRKKMCRHASDHLRKKMHEEPPENRSTRCPDVGGGRCFAVDGKLGRCYVVVDKYHATKHYELINNC